MKECLQIKLQPLLLFSMCFLLLSKAHGFSLFSFQPEGEYRLTKSKLSYSVKHIMHDAEGVSSSGQGKVTCENEVCKFRIETPVKTFITPDDRRDADMRKVTDEEKYPTVIVEGESQLKNAVSAGDMYPDFKKVSSSIKVRFHGEEKTISNVDIFYEKDGKDLKVKGDFIISLKDFSIKAPSLLGMPIEDSVKIKFDLSFLSN